MRRAASRLSGGRRPRRPGARIARVLRATQLLIAVILRRSPRDGRRIPALPLVAPLARTAKFARARRAASCLFGGPASPPATCSHRPRSPCDATLDRCHPSSVAALPLVAPLARTATFARMRRAASQGGSTGLQAGEKTFVRWGFSPGFPPRKTPYLLRSHSSRAALLKSSFITTH
jgi:hypothetical protein